MKLGLWYCEKTIYSGKSFATPKAAPAAAAPTTVICKAFDSRFDTPNIMALINPNTNRAPSVSPMEMYSATLMSGTIMYGANGINPETRYDSPMVRADIYKGLIVC